MHDDLKISISGIRGIVGKSLTIQNALGWVLAWERTLPAGPIVLARDARPHGEAFYHLLAGALHYCGRRILLAGFIPTPSVGILVRAQHAAGAVMLTASHNPPQWNALKLFNQKGVILTPEEFTQLEPIWNEVVSKGIATQTLTPDSTFQWAGETLLPPYQPDGSIEIVTNPLKTHLDLLWEEVDIDLIRNREFRVVVDGCRSVGGLALPHTLREAGVEVVELDCHPDGQFTRGLEPVPENLRTLNDKVLETHSDLGLAVDPDADRLALVSEKGFPIGEEYTLVLAADAILGKGGKGLVANLSSTLMLDAVAAKHGSPIYRSKVGEAHVVQLLQETASVIGGEGNGGVIYPKIQPGRDSLTGALLVLELLAREEKSLSQMIETYPPAVMIKTKMPAPEGYWEQCLEKGADAWQDAELNRLDGLKWIWSDRWIHLRPSNTEPIIRILAEAPTLEEGAKLVAELKGRLG